MSDTNSSIDWTAACSVALEWDDGHVPASFQAPPLQSPVPLTPNVPATSSTPSANDNDACSTCNGKRDRNDNGNSTDRSSLLPPHQQQPQQRTQQQQYLRWYPDYHCVEREAVYCIDDAVKEHLLDAIYNYTTQRAAATGMSTWGTYVTLEQIRQYWNEESKLVGSTMNDNEAPSTDPKPQWDTEHKDEKEKDALALAVAAAFLRQAVVASSTGSCQSDDDAATKSKVTRLCPQSSSVQSTSIPLWTERDCGLPTAFPDVDTTDKCQNGVTVDSAASASATIATAHGVAVWALSSDAPSLVPYHVDYAELIRYETGVIVLPVLAGTVHCSRINVEKATEAEVTTATTSSSGESVAPSTRSPSDHGAASCTMSGGDYMVHTTATTNGHSDKPCATIASQSPNGCATPSPIVLDHYKRHGYKSKLSSGAANWDHDNDLKECNDTASAVTSDLGSTTPVTTNNADGGTWIRIPYRFNRIICQSGHLPHLSTRIRSIHNNTAAADSCTSSCDGSDGNPPSTTSTKRVVVGLNVFLYDVGPTVQQAPEHSQAFRERVRRATPLYDNGDATASTSNRHHGTKPLATKGGLSLAALTANPRISRLLVQAKREKCRRDLVVAQEALDARIREYLRLEQESQSNATSTDTAVPTVTVQQVLIAFSPNEDDIPSDVVWPRTRSDIHVHLHRQWQKGTLAYFSSELDSRLQLTIVPYINQRGLVETDWFVGLPP